MMTINNNQLTPVVINQEDGSLVTTDNVILDKTYKLIYTLEGNEKPFVHTASGQQLLGSFIEWANTIANEIGNTDLNEIRHILTRYICPFATRQISKTEYRKVMKNYPREVQQFVKEANKNKYVLEQAHQFIEAYMYLKHMGAEFNETVLEVIDRPPSKSIEAELLKNWEESPLAQSGAVTTQEEFEKCWQAGSLATKWIAEQ